MSSLKQGFVLPEGWLRIVAATHHDPFEVLGRHPLAVTTTDSDDLPSDDTEVRMFLPGAGSANLLLKKQQHPLTRCDGTDFFIWQGRAADLPDHYQIEWIDRFETSHCEYDPYSFAPQLGDLDLHLFGEGRNWSIHEKLGAHVRRVDGVDGVLFAVWAPGAERISIVGDFNQWDGRRHPMRVRGGSGVWELFIPGLDAGTLYKFELRNRSTGQVFTKTDPYGRSFEHRPKTASIVSSAEVYEWQDSAWMDQ